MIPDFLVQVAIEPMRDYHYYNGVADGVFIAMYLDLEYDLVNVVDFIFRNVSQGFPMTNLGNDLEECMAAWHTRE